MCDVDLDLLAQVLEPRLIEYPLEKDDTIFVVRSDVLLGDIAEWSAFMAVASLTLICGTTRSCGVTSGMGSLLGGLEHRAEGLERQRALLPRVVPAEEQHREGGTGLVPAPKSPPRLWRGAVDNQLLE